MAKYDYLNDYLNNSSNEYSQGGWLDRYDEGGYIEPPVKQAVTPPVNPLEGRRYGELVHDFSDPGVRNALNYKANKIHLKSNSSCTAGALNCLTDWVQPALNTPSVRKMTEQNSAKYKVPSSDIIGKGDYVQNNSLDAWEIHQQMLGEGQGTSMLNNKVKQVYKSGKEFPEGFDYKNLPVGTILGQGESAGAYTDPKLGKRNRHAMSVIGYDKKDGMPLVYDYGKVRRIDDNTSGVDAGMPITNVTVPKGYEGYTKDKIISGKNLYAKTLGYDTKTTINFKSKKPHINAIQQGINESKDQIGADFGIPQKAINKMASYLPGIANTESGIANNEKTSLKYMFGDNAIGNKIAKPGLKAVGNAAKFIGNIASEDKPRRQDYQLEIEAYKKYGNDVKKRNVYLEELKDKESGTNKYSSLESSVGAFAIKNLPRYASEKLGINKDDFTSTYFTEEDKLRKGSKAALSHLAESYNSLKKTYPKLTEDQLTDLAVVAYNNQGKIKDKEFIKYYIQEGKMKDNYLRQVKGFKNYSQGGWLDQYN